MKTMTYEEKCKATAKNLINLAKCIEIEQKEMQEKYYKMYMECGIKDIFSKHERLLKVEVDVVSLNHQANFLIEVAIPEWVARDKPKNFKW